MARKIYTKTGDHGDTSLACGSRIPKDDRRVECYGAVDELSSWLGVVSAFVSRFDTSEALWQPLLDHLEWTQNRLFTLSSMIATINLPSGNMPELTLEDIEVLELHIDGCERDLPELRNFIIPGGSEVVSFLHVARTVCRRAERIASTLSREDAKLHPLILPFLNRLSDDLFVTGRWVAHWLGEPERIWRGRQ